MWSCSQPPSARWHLGAVTGPTCSFHHEVGAVYNLPALPRATSAAPFVSLNFLLTVAPPVYNMNSNCPMYSYLQYTPGENHSATFFYQCSASHQVGLIFFGYVSLNDSSFLIPLSLFSNGPALRSLSSLSLSPTFPHHPSPPRAPSHHYSLTRGIAGNAPFARDHSPVGRTGTDTN